MALDRTELKIYSNTGTEEEKRYANAIIPVSHCDVRRVTFFLSIWQRTVCVCVCVYNEPPPPPAVDYAAKPLACAGRATR